MRVSHRRDLTGMHLTGVYLIGVHFTGVHHRMQPFLLSRTYVFAAGGSPARGPWPKATLDTKLVRRYRAEQRAATRVRTRWSSRLQEAGSAVIRLLCIHRALYAVTRRRSSPGQGVSGLSLSRKDWRLAAGSRARR
jgi:hypothetical protein